MKIVIFISGNGPVNNYHKNLLLNNNKTFHYIVVIKSNFSIE